MKFILLLTSFLASVSAYAQPTYTCEPDSNWGAEPTVDSSNVFHGTLIVKCTVTGGYGDGLARLQRYLADQISSFQDRVGPRPETTEGLPGITYSGIFMGDPRIDEEVHIATDNSARLLYSTVSKKIDGSGNSKYLKQLGIRVDIRSAKQVGIYSLSLAVSMGISKPWYAPGGEPFRIVAKSITKKIFSSQQDQTLPDLVRQL